MLCMVRGLCRKYGPSFFALNIEDHDVRDPKRGYPLDNPPHGDLGGCKRATEIGFGSGVPCFGTTGLLLRNLNSAHIIKAYMYIVINLVSLKQ